MTDHVQIRVYAGATYSEVRVPREGDRPIVRGEMVEPRTDAEPILVARLGSYLIEITWPLGEKEPVVEVSEDATLH